MLWGSSPCLDLAAYDEVGDGNLNVLIVSAGDTRHLLQTLAKRYKHSYAKICIYVYEPVVDMYARHIQQIALALEPVDRMSLQYKVRTWMELYGNSLVKPNTNSYLIKKSAQLIDIITDETARQHCLPIIQLDALKYKERDTIENIFKYWKNNNGFNITMMWDKRVRNYLGTRYDHRNNVFDWDLHMTLHYIDGGNRITNREYTYWRDTGIAYTFLETDCTEPNYTFALALLKDGDKITAMDYFGDIINGPFPSFGLDCEDDDMLKMGNMQPLKRSVDLTERNLIRMFYEIENQKPYKHKGKTDNLGVIITELPNVKIQEIQTSSPRVKVMSEHYSSINVNDVEIHFIPRTAMEDYPTFDRYKNFFDVMYCGHMYFEKMNFHITSMIKDGGVVLMETRKFIVNYKQKQHDEFKQKLMDLMENCKCMSSEDIDIVKNAVIKFNKQH
ncbi:dynein assembly factor 3, axonemal homolog [Rhopalosiphum maidis]|uniref:dynein assembly factor 3, axonemal homolog n=1 Tax=Rhopalosiphum maidis TaxID=43146 RepID=UPI000EFF5865|nr:dynein assembly factor 3, axonemal homolog [Rhopalosiphum maidis]